MVDPDRGFPFRHFTPSSLSTGRAHGFGFLSVVTDSFREREDEGQLGYIRDSGLPGGGDEVKSHFPFRMCKDKTRLKIKNKRLNISCGK